MKLIDGHAMIQRVEALHKRDAVDLSYFNIVKEAVQMEPAVDAAPVVRCLDCKHGEPTHNARGEAVIKCEEICWLCRLPRLMEPDWFCADGERREE